MRLEYTPNRRIMTCMNRVNMYIPTPMLASLRALATERGISVAELVRRAVEDFLRRQK